MKLSIVIPAYNAEKTLARTVETVLAQTFKDFELLIVNNGSKDATGDVARQLATQDSRIRVFDVYPNIWGYGARLYGWKQAKGEYIASVDADDFISPEMYEVMVGLAERHHLDVVECEYDECANFEPCRNVEDVELDVVLENREAVIDKVVRPTFVDVGRSAYVWNKIYRNQYDFSQWKQGIFGSYEDLIHNLQLFRPVSRYGHVNRAFYHYAPSPTSVTRNYSADRIDQFATAATVKRELIQSYGISGDDPVFNRWVLNDAGNGILSASVFGKMEMSMRVELIHSLLALPVVRAAAKHGDLGNSSAILVALARFSPVITAQLLRLAYKLKRLS